MTPKYRYFPKNTNYFKTVPNSIGINVFLLCAININGVLAYDIRFGSSKTEYFIDYIDKKLPNNNINSAKLCVLDKASIHESATVAQTNKRKNSMRRFLPACTPKLNPNKEFYSPLKSRCNANALNHKTILISLSKYVKYFTAEFSIKRDDFRHMMLFIEKALMNNDFI